MANRKDRLDRIEQYMTRGWAPASYRHLHPELKRVIRTIGFRPGFKECYRNCQRIMVAVDAELGRRLEYHEGILLTLKIPIPHAWLKLDGVIQDPTLSGKQELYGESHVYTADAIRTRLLQTRVWGPVDDGAIALLMRACVAQGGALRCD